MEGSAYICYFRSNSEQKYFLWLSADLDGVGVEAGKVAVFKGIPTVQAYANIKGMTFCSEEPVFYDFEELSRWVCEPLSDSVNCNDFLNAWNLFGDAASSFGVGFIGADNQLNPIYDKLFWGCNLPAVNPPDKSYEPIWSKAETIALASVIAEGLALFDFTPFKFEEPQRANYSECESS